MLFERAHLLTDLDGRTQLTLFNKWLNKLLKIKFQGLT